MTIQELFIRANEELKKVIDQIRDDQWSIDMPEGLSSKSSNLHQAINYHIYDDAWVPDILIGKAKEEVGDAYEELFLTQNTKETYATYNARANDAVRVFTDLENVTHLSYGDFPAREYLQHITLFRALRSYDIANLIEIASPMEPSFVQGLITEFTPHVEQYRQFGILPPALEVPSGADPQTVFLAMIGRR